MNVYEVMLLVIDYDEIGGHEIAAILESIDYPNHCMYPKVVKVTKRTEEDYQALFLDDRCAHE